MQQPLQRSLRGFLQKAAHILQASRKRAGEGEKDPHVGNSNLGMGDKEIRDDGDPRAIYHS